MWFKLKWWFWWITGVTNVSLPEIEKLIKEIVDDEMGRSDDKPEEYLDEDDYSRYQV